MRLCTLAAGLVLFPLALGILVGVMVSDHVLAAVERAQRERRSLQRQRSAGRPGQQRRPHADPRPPRRQPRHRRRRRLGLPVHGPARRLPAPRRRRGRQRRLRHRRLRAAAGPGHAHADGHPHSHRQPGRTPAQRRHAHRRQQRRPQPGRGCDRAGGPRRRCLGPAPPPRLSLTSTRTQRGTPHGVPLSVSIRSS